MKKNWEKFIISIPNLLQGKPRMKSARILVSLILGYLAIGSTVEEIIKKFSDIKKEQNGAYLDFVPIYQNLRMPYNEIEVLCRP